MIDITEIKRGFPGITPVAAMQLYEAFEVCMHTAGHGGCIPLQMEGITERPINLCWKEGYDSQKARTYADMQYTVEHGAVCLSVMLARHLTPYTVIERSRKGTGFDYWLGDSDSLLFQKKARLEVSGMLKGDSKTLKRRYDEKARQTNRSDGLCIPAFISVIEFGTPKAIFNEKQI